VSLWAGHVAAASSVNVPLEHWSYAALEKLSGFGLLASDLKGTRPYTRREAARLVVEASAAAASAADALPPIADRLLKRLRREFRDELAVLGAGDGNDARTFLKPLEYVRLRYVYSEGAPRTFIGYPQSGSGIQATEGTPLVENNEGVVYGEQSNVTLQFSSSFQWDDVFCAYVEPIVIFRENDVDYGKVLNFPSLDTQQVDLLKGYAKAALRNAELEAGRDSLWWGQGRHGSLLLTNLARPLNLIKVSNAAPTLLPWFLEALGPFKYATFSARLEEERDFSHPWLTGVRVNFMPHPNFEMGVATTFIHGGEGRPSLTLGDLWSLFTLQQGDESGKRKVNALGGFDFRLRIPALGYSELYAEYGGEDTGIDGPIFDDTGWLVGLYLPRLTPDGRTDLRIEYAYNAIQEDRTPGFWYGHTIYRTGYTFDRLIMGHHMAPDAEDLFARATCWVSDRLLLGGDVDYMRRGLTLSLVQEENLQFGIDASLDVTEAVTVKSRYAFEEVRNFDLKQGDDRQNQFFMMELTWRF
jgi:hypothetical protein